MTSRIPSTIEKERIIDKIKKLDAFSGSYKSNEKKDWLLIYGVKNDDNKYAYKAGVYRFSKINKPAIILSNGLVGRVFVLDPNGATIDYLNMMTGESLLRGVKTEARITLNGQEYKIGGLKGQKEYGYLLYEWVDSFENEPNSFQLHDFEISDIKKRFEWKKVRYCEDREWPPKGIELIMHYKPPGNAPDEIQNIIVSIHYECYDGIPLFSKWITIETFSPHPTLPNDNSPKMVDQNNNMNTKSKVKQVRLNSFVNESLALVEAMSTSAGGMNTESSKIQYPHIYFEYDYAFAGMNAEGANHLTHWKMDKEYTSQVAYLSDSLVLMESHPEMGPGIDLVVSSGENKDQKRPIKLFEGFREFQLVLDSYDRQRNSLARCQMYRTIAPWITENPIMMHLTSMDPKKVKTAVEQMKEVGFEMLIFSFGSGFNDSVLELEIYHPEWVEDMAEEIKDEILDGIKKNGIEVGGYSLLASRKISEEDDVVNPYTGKTNDVNSPKLEDGIEAIQGVDNDIANIPGIPTFGNSPCLGSNWGKKYFDSLYHIIDLLDLNIIEHDGSYPGDVCASTKHPGHRNLFDSQWQQWRIITDFYKWCRSKGVYLNVPDWYMLTGSSKTGIGYKEVNWSLPRDRQVILGRQNIYDGTWEKTPSMGWTFCPLTKYHSIPEYPAEVATLEPLSEHLEHYEAHLAQNFGCGVQACYRGFRLYDSDKTKNLVKKYVNWYKKYRAILDSDIVHIRRPDGRNIDGILHVNPKLEIKGLAMFFNPSSEDKTEIIRIPLYYTGLGKKTSVRREEEEILMEYEIKCSGRDKYIDLPVDIKAKSHTWFTFK